jgi:titin
LARFTPDVLSYSPKYVFLMGGTNDVMQGVSATTIENNLAAMCNLATSAGAKTFLLNIPPATLYTSAQNTEVAQVNAWIATQGSANVIPVNDHDVLASGTTLIPAYDNGDGEHPSSLGMAVIAKTTVKAGQANGIFTNVKFWTAAADGAASTAANWAGGVAPVAGDRLVFDSGSVKNCSLNQAITYGSISTVLTYTGTLTIGANLGTTDDQVYIKGTLAGSTSYIDTCAGDFIQFVGVPITSGVLNLNMAGSGKNLQVSSFNFYDLTFNGNTNIVFDTAFAAHDLVIASGVTVTNYNGLGGLTWMPSYGGDTFTNNGYITGTGPLTLQLDASDITMALGRIDCPTTIGLASWAGDSRTLTMSASGSVGALTITSAHATNTVTLDLAGHVLSAKSIAISARGVLSSTIDGAMINATGDIGVALDGTMDMSMISLITSTSCTGQGVLDGTGSTAFIIPNGTTAIATYAFYTCYPMSAVTVPSGVTSIGSMAFASCMSLTSIKFLGLVAPTSVGASWMLNTAAGIRGHAYAASNFPAPGGVWNGLTMGTVNPTVPGVPTGLTATAGNAQVTLNWVAPASDGGSAIDYYIIYQNGVALPTHATGLTTTITGLTNGQSYSFTVAAHNAIGPSVQTGAQASTPYTVPNAPTGLTAVAGNAQVTLNWVAPVFNGGSAIDYYVIYQNAIALPSHPTGLTTVITGLTNGQSYSFTVAAHNLAGAGAQTGVTVSTPFTVPNAPTGLTAVPGNTQVTLNWTAAFNGGSAITGYKLYRAATETGTYTEIALPTGTTYTDTGLTNGQAYWYKVSAVNAAGEGAKTVQISAIPFAGPGVPTGLTAVPGNTQVTLNWTAPASNGGSAITGYKLYRAATETGTYTEIASPTGTTYTDTGLTNGQAYWYKVSAVNTAGEGAKTAQISSVPFTVPDVPTGLTAVAGNAQVTLNWTAPAFNGGNATDYYVIYQDGTPLVAHFTGLTTTITGLTNGQIYSFNVSAHNLAGEGAQTGAVVSTPFTVPNAPTGLTAIPGNTQVTLNWTAPTLDGGRSIDHYVIYQDGNPLVAYAPGLTATITGLTNGQSYSFTVAGNNSAGIGPLSAPCTATPYTVPSSPVLTTATAGNLNVTLVWTAPASNGYSPLTAYETYFGTSVVNTTWTKFSTVGASVLSEKITGLTVGTTYYFGVKAVNAAGNSSMSNGLNVTVMGVPGAPTGLTATAIYGKVTMTWSAPVNTGGSPIIDYKVYRGLSAASVFKIGNSSLTTFVDITATPGSTFYYKISSVNVVGEGNQSVYATALVPTLVPVTGKIVDANGNVLAGITVALENGSSVLTDAQGNFTIMASPGNHSLTISGPGIETKKVDISVSTSGLAIGSVSTSKTSGSDSTLIILAAVLIAAVLALFVAILIIRRGRKGKQ